MPDLNEPTNGIDSNKSPSSTISKESKYTWVAVGHGSYNRVWKSNFSEPTRLVTGETYQGPWVLKYPTPSGTPVTDAMNDKNRAIRVWNEVNHTLPKAGLHKEGWVAPYISNTRYATDDEISKKLIEIFIDKRRIIVDAATTGNFLTTNTGEVILVDVDLALKRSKSLASFNFAKNLDERFASYWADQSLRASKPKTLNVTRNLLYIEDHLDTPSIDKFCANNQITLTNMLSLTWLRDRNLRLTHDLFETITSFNAADIPLNDEILEALVPHELLSEPLQPSEPVEPKISSSTVKTRISAQSIFTSKKVTSSIRKTSQDLDSIVSTPQAVMSREL